MTGQLLWKNESDCQGRFREVSMLMLSSTTLSKRLPAAALGVLLAACSGHQPGAPIKPGMNFFSVQQDIELGKQAAEEVRQQMDIVRDAAVQNYVKRIGERLVQTNAAKSSGFPFEFTVVNEKSINAFALPGGPMFVFSGLIASADNEAQVAGVMGHEMAHVILRHGTNQVSKAQLLELPAQIGGAVAAASVGNEQLGQLVQVGAALGLNSLLLKFSRGAETQADILGSRIMAEAGYNPIEMARFFEKLEGDGGSRAPEFFSDHPNPGNRIKRIESEIAVMPQQSYGFQAGDFGGLKRSVAALPEPKPPQKPQPAAPQVSQPSNAQWRQVRGPTFQMSMPGDWEMVQSNGTPATVVAPRGGLVRQLGGSVAIGFGLMLNYYAPQTASDLGGASQELWRQMMRADPSMQIGSNARQVRLSGATGLMTQYQTESPFGGPEQGVIITVARPEGLFYIIGAAPRQNAQQLQQMLDQVVGSLRFTR
ncbi:MAG: M48 family metallopeptidase [Bryobacteraceae bacterium]